jgi:O-antigen ligase
MESSQNIASSFPSLSRHSLVGPLPWGTSLISLFLAFIACEKLKLDGPSSAVGNISVTIFVVVCASLTVSLFPSAALRAFVCLYLALRALGVSSILGYYTVAYVSLVLAVLLVCRLDDTNKSKLELPGTTWLLCLGALVFLQFFRAVSMRDAFPILCEQGAFTLVVWKFLRISRADLRDAAIAFVMGTCWAGLAFLLTSPLGGYRLGFDLGFNPNEFGNIVGAALLLLGSGFLMRERRFSLWFMIVVLSILLVLTGSRTSFYACLGGIVLSFLLRRRRSAAIFLSIAILAAFLVISRGPADDDPFSLTGRLLSPVSQSFDESGAQRAAIWAFLLDQVGEYWKVGAGLSNVSEVVISAGVGRSETANIAVIGYQTHNLYFTVILELGVLGLFFLLAWQFRILYCGFRRSFDNSLLVPMMLYLIIQGFLQGSNLNFFSGFLLVAACSVQPSAVQNNAPRHLRLQSENTPGRTEIQNHD